jgi:hypothetical protein
MSVRNSSAFGALLLAFAMLALVSDASAAPADSPGNSANAKTSPC